MPTPVASLGYSRSARPLHRRPGTRLVALVLAVSTLAWLAHRYVPILSHNLSTYSAQRACLAYIPPEKHILYDDGPYTPNQTLLTYLSLRTSAQQARDVCHAAAFPFLHKRTAPAGQPRLVTVSFQRAVKGEVFYLSATAEPVLSPFSVLPLSSQARPAGAPFRLYLSPTDRLRLYAGSPDPANPARFTIPLTINDTPYTLDGLLSPADTVTLTPRTGTTTQTPQGPYWTPTNAPNIEYLWNGLGLY